MIRPGPRNLITDVAGLRVGNATDVRIRSGVTVVLPDVPVVAAVDVRGGAPGTRETEALSPTTLVDRVDAVVLSGGSIFGIDAASGVTEWLAAAGRGFEIGGVRMPIVPAAVLFDLAIGGARDWDGEPPYRSLGVAACNAASSDLGLGNIGAGMGAVSGRLKGGLGSASLILEEGPEVGALVAVNSAGSAVIPGTSTLWAWAVEEGGEFGGMGPPERMPDWTQHDTKLPLEPGTNTTIGVVATSAALTPAEAQRVAIMAHDGIARAVRPAHTPFDGDTLFALATGAANLPIGPTEVALIGAAASTCVERAIGRAVYQAEPMGDIVALRTAE